MIQIQGKRKNRTGDAQMNGFQIAGQIVGIVAAAVMIISFQFKDTKKLFISQVCSTLLFTLHYALLGFGGDSGAFAGMAQNFAGVAFRVVILLSEKHEKLKSPIALTVLCAYSAVAAALLYNGNIVTLLPTAGNVICMGIYWSGNKNTIRLGQLAVVSPCWLIYNIFTLSISGIFTETFNIISIIVYYIRIKAEKNNEKA